MNPFENYILDKLNFEDESLIKDILWDLFFTVHTLRDNQIQISNLLNPLMRFATFRHIILKKKLKRVDSPKNIAPPFYFIHGENIEIEYTPRINYGVFLTAGEKSKIIIKKNSIFGPKVMIWSVNHNFEDVSKPIWGQGSIEKDVIIEENCWIGADAIILPGVRIGTGSIIGARAVVTKDIPPYSVATGVPARVIKSRLDE